jgi:hypothetical protein
VCSRGVFPYPAHSAALKFEHRTLFAAYSKAKGIWRDEERGGALVKDEPVVVHCYTTPDDIENDRNLAELGRFCRKIGHETRQGEVGLVVDTSISPSATLHRSER